MLFVHFREVKAVNIKPILVRLQNAIGRNDLIEQMVLHTVPTSPLSQRDQSDKSVNLIVGYNSSPRSHTALDICLLIAHQTRLATKAHVTVQIVYVLEDNHQPDWEDILSINEVPTSNTSSYQTPSYPPENLLSTGASTGVLNQLELQPKATYRKIKSTEQLTQAEYILRQAMCLAEEWKSSFKAHLRFGSVAQELTKVVEAEAASMLIIGCNSVAHPLVRKLGSRMPCPVLGIPNCVEQEV